MNKFSAVLTYVGIKDITATHHIIEPDGNPNEEVDFRPADRKFPRICYGWDYDYPYENFAPAEANVMGNPCIRGAHFTFDKIHGKVGFSTKNTRHMGIGRAHYSSMLPKGRIKLEGDSYQGARIMMPVHKRKFRCMDNNVLDLKLPVFCTALEKGCGDPASAFTVEVKLFASVTFSGYKPKLSAATSIQFDVDNANAGEVDLDPGNVDQIFGVI